TPSRRKRDALPPCWWTNSQDPGGIADTPYPRIVVTCKEHGFGRRYPGNMKIFTSSQIMKEPEIRELQEKRLLELIAYLAHHSPYYKNLFTTHGIHPETIRKLSDLENIPVTEKEDLQKHNEDFLCVPGSSVIEYTSTSGTLGSPVTIALTERDLQRLAY